MRPEKILLVSPDPSEFAIKIADLGFARNFDAETNLDNVVGTPLFRAPEVVREEMYNDKIDVWGVGCITYQLLCGLSPFNAKTEALITRGICSNKPIKFKDPNWESVSSNAKDFVKKCLERN